MCKHTNTAPCLFVTGLFRQYELAYVETLQRETHALGTSTNLRELVQQHQA